ncbi:MAG: hypothetical protein BWY67_02088 [Bacteroidetes bacterium ADurb.Bin397]|nr:MAG: hypothetical protein BWY67_02088 [Bacteroidetes bacterium ADurb.Bin397]
MICISLAFPPPPNTLSPSQSVVVAGINAVVFEPVAIGEPPVGSVNHSKVPEPVPVRFTIPGPHRVTAFPVGTGITPTVINTSFEVSGGQAVCVTIALKFVVAKRETE